MLRRHRWEVDVMSLEGAAGLRQVDVATARRLFPYLIYVEILNDVVEFRIQVVEEVHHLRGGRGKG